jgi:hypothetical protein
MLSPSRVPRSILIVTLVGLALRLAWWWYGHPDPVADFEYYRRMAADLLDHHQLGYPKISAVRVPAYPAFLAAAMLVSRSVAWLSLVNVILSSLLVPLAFRFARALTIAPGAAVAAAWIAALVPTFVFFAPVLASEHLFVLFLLLSLVVALGAETRSRFALAGVLFGAAILTRPDALFYTPVLAGVAWLRSRAPRAAAPAIVLLSAIVVVSPWLVRNRLVMGPGAGLSTVGGLNFYYAHNDRKYGWSPPEETPLAGLDEVATQTRGYALGLEYLSHAGADRIVSDLARGTRDLYSPAAFPFALFWSTRQATADPDKSTPNAFYDSRVLHGLAGLYAVVLCGAGLSVLLIRRCPPAASGVLYGIVAMSWIGHCWIFWADPRYRYVSEVMFCVLTAVVASVVLRISSLRRSATRSSG